MRTGRVVVADYDTHLGSKKVSVIRGLRQKKPYGVMFFWSRGAFDGGSESSDVYHGAARIQVIIGALCESGPLK